MLWLHLVINKDQFVMDLQEVGVMAHAKLGLPAGTWSLLGPFQLHSSSITRYTERQEQEQPRQDGELGWLSQKASFG